MLQALRLAILRGMVQKVIRVMKVSSAIVAAGLLVSVFVTSPNELGPFGITTWFILLLYVLASILTLVIYRAKKDFTSQGFAQAIRKGFLLGIWITALLALAGLRQLTIRDIILLTVLVIVVDFYMRRMKK